MTPWASSTLHVRNRLIGYQLRIALGTHLYLHTTAPSSPPSRWQLTDALALQPPNRRKRRNYHHTAFAKPKSTAQDPTNVTGRYHDKFAGRNDFVTKKGHVTNLSSAQCAVAGGVTQVRVALDFFVVDRRCSIRSRLFWMRFLDIDIMELLCWVGGTYLVDVRGFTSARILLLLCLPQVPSLLVLLARCPCNCVLHSFLGSSPLDSSCARGIYIAPWFRSTCLFVS